MKKYFILIIAVIFIMSIFSCDLKVKKDAYPEFTRTKRIYWTAQGIMSYVIKCAEMTNLTDKITIIGDLGYKPGSIEIDSTGKKMYWIDTTNKKIMRSNLDGTVIESIVAGLVDIPDICLDPVENKIYFIDNGKINRANLDGTGVEVFLNEPAKGLVIDISEGKIYWKGMSDIHRVNRDRTGIEQNYTGDSQNDFALDLINKKIYVAPNLAARGFVKMDLNGTNSSFVDVGQLVMYNFIIDPFAGNIYYLNLFGVTSSIKQCGLDGTVKPVLIPEDPDYRYSIALQYE
jgi:hypothetical protein